MTEFEKAMKRAHARRDRRRSKVTETYHRRLDTIERDFQNDSLAAQREHMERKK